MNLMTMGNEGVTEAQPEKYQGLVDKEASVQTESKSHSDWGPRGTAGVSFAAALSFDKVDVRIGGRKILDKIDLSLIPGEIVCLLGESGSGKSTILRVAAGIQSISAGEVRVNGKCVSAKGVEVLPKERGVGLMFQDFALFPHLTLLNNVCFGLNQLKRNEAITQARSALKRVGLLERQNDYPHMLSGGQQQRLALARTFAPKPGVLMLDEPFSSLDARLRENVRVETLAILRETRATTIIVTHDPEEAMVLGDRIALLRQGRVVQIDTPGNIYSHPVDLETAKFFSPLTQIDAVVNAGAAQSPLGEVKTPRHKNGQEVTLAIRPVGALEITTVSGGVPGRILSKREALGLDIFEVQVLNIDAPVIIRATSKASRRPGDDILLSLNPEHVLVFDRV